MDSIAEQTAVSSESFDSVGIAIAAADAASHEAQHKMRDVDVAVEGRPVLERALNEAAERIESEERNRIAEGTPGHSAISVQGTAAAADTANAAAAHTESRTDSGQAMQQAAGRSSDSQIEVELAAAAAVAGTMLGS